MGQPLDDRGLADPRLADQHRIVFRTPLQDLDGSANLVVAADHRIELAVLGTLGHVDGVLVERLTRFLGIGVVYRLSATQVGNGILQRLFRYTLAEQQLAESGIGIQRRQQDQLAGDVLVALLLRQAIGLIEQPRQVLGHVHVPGRVLQFRQTVEFLGQRLTERIDVEAHLHQQRLDRAALLFEQRLHQVKRLDGRVVQANGNGLCVGEGKLQLAGQTVYTHEDLSSSGAGRH